MAFENITAVIALTLVACTLCQWIAWRVRLPAIIFLLFTGILAGPVFGLFQPEALLGNLFFPFVSISVALILFEGSLALNFKEILGLEAVVRNMLSFGMAVTWFITALAAKYCFGLSWEIAFLFGAITVVTGPTVIMPMLRTVRPTQAVSKVLMWEGIVIDPIGASLAVLVYEFIISGGGNTAWGHTFVTLGTIIAIGAIMGAFGGYFFGLTIRYQWLPEFLHNVAALTLVISAFIASNLLQPESGLVTVTVMGVWLANMKGVDMASILDFKESISLLLISLLFIMLAARLDLHALKGMGWNIVLVLVAIQFLARPLNVMVSALGSTLTWPERHMLAWIAPRGIVSAAIAALFSAHLENQGFPGADLLIPLTFSVIIFTVVLQSTTARPIAKWLKVAEPEPTGFLIIGSNIVGRSIAKALLQNGIHVLLADTSWDEVSKAKIQGLNAYFGNPVSGYADRYIDLAGIGRMLAVSTNEDLNTAAMMHYRMELGRNNVFLLQSRHQAEGSERKDLPTRGIGSTLFNKKLTYGQMASILSKEDGEIRTTKLNHRFDFKEFTKKHNHLAVPLFAISPKGMVHVFSQEQKITPKPKWSIIYLRGSNFYS